MSLFPFIGEAGQNTGESWLSLSLSAPVLARPIKQDTQTQIGGQVGFEYCFLSLRSSGVKHADWTRELRPELIKGSRSAADEKEASLAKGWFLKSSIGLDLFAAISPGLSTGFRLAPVLRLGFKFVQVHVRAGLFYSYLRYHIEKHSSANDYFIRYRNYAGGLSVSAGAEFLLLDFLWLGASFTYDYYIPPRRGSYPDKVVPGVNVTIYTNHAIYAGLTFRKEL
jgi:hypothetical protein